LFIDGNGWIISTFNVVDGEMLAYLIFDFNQFVDVYKKMENLDKTYFTE
jgi:hypothetical protein